MDSTNGQRKITKIIVLEKGKETAVSTPMTKKEEQSVKPESKGEMTSSEKELTNLQLRKKRSRQNLRVW